MEQRHYPDNKSMTMKTLQYLALLLSLTMAMASCSGDSFKIDGKLANFDSGMVRVIFPTDSGMVDEWVNVDNKGKFSYKGAVADPVIVSLLDSRSHLLVMLVATSGDHIKVKGDAAQPKTIKIKGSKVNEDWQLFRDEHATFYSNPNPSRLNAAIEKYVREHPADMLSTVLLMADYRDYGDGEKVNAMLKGIEVKARPGSLVHSFEGNSVRARGKGLPHIVTLTLLKHGGDFEEISLVDHMSLISFWANPQDNRSALINKLSGAGEDIRVIDVLTESDTLRWHQTIAADPKEWKHYWAPGGPLEQGVQLLGIKTLPWYAVTDSTGLVTYSGPNLDAALGKVTVKSEQ